MHEFELIDSGDSMGLVSSAIEARDSAENQLKDGKGDERFVRMDESYDYLELLADAAIKIAFRHIAGHGGALEVKMNTFASKVISEYEAFVKRAESFLNQSEIEIICNEFPWVIKSILDSTEYDPFDVQDSLVFANELSEKFSHLFDVRMSPKGLSEREQELIELKRPYHEKRELLNKLLRATYPDGENRPTTVDEFAEALAYDQIYEIQRQFEVYSVDDDYHIEGMFGHLVNSILTIRKLSKTKRAYTTPEEAGRINWVVRGIIYEYYKENPRYLELFEKAFREMADENN